jgi:S1-C subfamily serine protease
MTSQRARFAAIAGVLLAIAFVWFAPTALRAAASSGKGTRLEIGKSTMATLDLERASHADFYVDMPEGSVALRWRLVSPRVELTLAARRGSPVDDEIHDFESPTDGGKALISYDRFSEPPIGKDRFHARVSWTFQSRPRTAQESLTRIPFTIVCEGFASRVDGALKPGSAVPGVLDAASGSFRTYRIDVPAATKSLRLDITESESDLDLFAHPGSPFVALDDTLRFSQHAYGRETIVVNGDGDKGVTPGVWFVDVVDSFDEDHPAAFTLLATFDAQAPVELLAFPALAKKIGDGPVARALAAVVEVSSDDATGSGTILSADGWILTNAHVVEALGGGSLKEVVVALTLDPREPARELFRASVERYDEARDMALLKVRSGFYGQPVPADVVLPTLDLGKLESPAIGDTLWLVGYPSTGGRGSRVTISATRGIVSGFDQASFGTVLKTDAEITNGNSGGAALDEKGRLIGIPTSTVENGSGQIGYVHPITVMPAEWLELAGLAARAK